MRRVEDVTLTRAAIDAFVDECARAGCSAGTVEGYRDSMNRVYDALADDKRITSASAVRMRDALLDKGFSPSTVNMTLSVFNTWLGVIGRRELQLPEKVDMGNRYVPELTRNEYLRLLKTAKAQGDEFRYLLTKVIALTGIRSQDLPTLTVESVRDGRPGMPDFLARELLAFAGRRGTVSGPIFCNRDGKPILRTRIPTILQRRCAASGVAREKITAKNLERLRQSAIDAVEANADLLVERYIDNQLEQEEAVYGWDR